MDVTYGGSWPEEEIRLRTPGLVAPALLDLASCNPDPHRLTAPIVVYGDGEGASVTATRVRWCVGNSILLALTLFAVWFWAGADRVSHYAGAQAAQADVGIFINLVIGGPVLLGLTFFAWMQAGYGPGSRLTNA